MCPAVYATINNVYCSLHARSNAAEFVSRAVAKVYRRSICICRRWDRVPTATATINMSAVTINSNTLHPLRTSLPGICKYHFGVHIYTRALLTFTDSLVVSVTVAPNCCNLETQQQCHHCDELSPLPASTWHLLMS